MELQEAALIGLSLFGIILIAGMLWLLFGRRRR
ncbi:MAG: LPXTG cell wall anchor domain-containing protein [Methanomassiliicoccales archaeon]|nr:MAG: LPXTG cell wall anchor domain-containing protein [Methanomassiliicoccales archaeon]